VKHYTILPEDQLILASRIQQLEQQLEDLGTDFKEAVEQSSETWHDNAPFDAVRDRQSVVFNQLQSLREVQKKVALYKAAKRSFITPGSKVELEGKEALRIYLGGDWVGREIVDGYKVVSRQSPIGMQLDKKHIGEVISLPAGEFVIRNIC